MENGPILPDSDGGPRDGTDGERDARSGPDPTGQERANRRLKEQRERGKKKKRVATRGLPRRSPILVLLSPNTLNCAVLMGSSALVLV